MGTTLKRGTVTGRVIAGAPKKDKRPFYAHMIEYGTKAHRIQAKKGKVLAIGVSAVNHPGIRPHPFLRPALDSKSTAAVEAVREYIRKRLADKHGIEVPAPLEDGDE